MGLNGLDKGVAGVDIYAGEPVGIVIANPVARRIGRWGGDGNLANAGV
jgi:hypothetical protein